MIDMNTYQELASETAVFPDGETGVTYTTLGLNGEAGEVAEKVKKVIRDRDGQMDTDTVVEIGKELGDVLWYLSQLARLLDLDLETIARGNLNKLASRKLRGRIGGSGDNR